MNAPSTPKQEQAQAPAQAPGKTLNDAPSKQNLAAGVAAQAAAQVPAVPAQGGTSSVPAKANQDTWEVFMNANRKDFEMVLPAHFKAKGGADKLIRLALTAMRRNPALLQCSMASLAASILDCCALGLEFNSPLQQAYIIPFKDNDKKSVEATLVIGYRGLIDLHLRSSAVSSIFASVVYEADKWDFEYGSNELLFHKPAKVPPSQRGEKIAAYAYAKLTSGGTRFVWLWSHEILRIRDEYSKGYEHDPKTSPWITDEDAMWRKTAVRELSKWVPKSADAERAAHVDGKPSDSPRIGDDRAFSESFAAVAGGLQNIPEAQVQK